MPGCCTQLNRLLSTLQHRPARWLQNASVTEHLPKGAALTVQQLRRETERERNGWERERLRGWDLTLFLGIWRLESTYGSQLASTFGHMSGGAKRNREVGWVRLQECKTINSPLSSQKCPFYSISTIFVTGPKRVQGTGMDCTRSTLPNVHAQWAPVSASAPAVVYLLTLPPTAYRRIHPMAFHILTLLPHSITAWKTWHSPTTTETLTDMQSTGTSGIATAKQVRWCSL